MLSEANFNAEKFRALFDNRWITDFGGVDIEAPIVPIEDSHIEADQAVQADAEFQESITTLCGFSGTFVEPYLF